jgi:hypothetical protein
VSATRNQLLETLATVARPSVKVYSWSIPELPFLDLCELVAVRVLQHRCLAQAECLAVHLVGPLAESVSIQKSSPIETSRWRIL